MIEIERKFLVTSQDFKKAAFKQSAIHQGYLSTDPERTVRIRIVDQLAFLTVKGKGSLSGMSRFEWETEIPKKDAAELLKRCLSSPIVKKRYFVKHGVHVFEVDVFEGIHQGLTIAEIELKSENEKVLLPNWIGKEVTGDKRYYNSFISSIDEKKS
ncbi:MAG: CYTH domain-containing protein [Flavobacteriaceae bacterium]